MLKTAPLNKGSGSFGVFAPPAIVRLRATVTLTSAAYANRTLLMDAAGAALTFTLPAAVGTGDVYRFVVSVVNTSNYVINVTGDDTIDGNIWTNSTGDSPDLGQPWPSAAASDTITLNGTTKGGVSIGDYVELMDIDTDQWIVIGFTTSSSTEATPFSEAV